MNRADKTIRIGARGSRLSLAQANSILNMLKSAWPELHFELKTIKTSGDKDTRSPLSGIGGQGVFIKELEIALLQGEIDIAVHSAKDLPSRLTNEFTLAAVPQRAPVEDALITINGTNLMQMLPGARIATGSPRRRAYIKALRPDLQIVEVRGNVDTRLQKLKASEFEGIVLALAGLIRLKLDHHVAEIFSAKNFLPSAGQGALALEIRAGDSNILKICKRIDSMEHHAALTAERKFMQTLGVGCSVPVGAWARSDRSALIMDTAIISHDGQLILRSEGCLPALDRAQELGEQLARDLLIQGAKQLINDEN